jgi:hypothetical protein
VTDIAPGQGDENYKVIGGGDDSFPDEYSVSGWFKWVGDYKGAWHLVFRFTTNDKPDNQDASRLGDRTLTIFANNGQFYHCPTYTYVNMNAGGNANSVQNLAHQGLNVQWHFVYFGYSKSEKRAFVNVVLKSGALQLNYPNHNHYWTEKFFFVLRDARYPNFSGQLSLVNVNLGKGAFKAAADHNADNDIFGYGAGSKKFQGTTQPLNINSGNDAINAATDKASPFTKEVLAD